MKPWAGRALSLIVTSFDGQDLRPLPFRGASDDLAAALDEAGYDLRQVVNPTTTQLGSAVEEFLRSADSADSGPLIVHVMTHGRLTANGSLYALGSDGLQHPSAHVNHWLLLLDDYPDRPYTLFLLDLCHSGTAARPAWLSRQLGSDHRAWVIAAADVDQYAYDARFTTAAARAIRRLNAGEEEFDCYPGIEYVGFPAVARAVRQTVDDLTPDGWHSQDVTTTPIDSAADHGPLPFFRNPRYSADPTARLHASVGSSLSAYVDEVLDVPHWRDRSAGYGPLQERIEPQGQFAVGCFTGREHEVGELAEWLDSGDAPLRMLTGGPGSGKSALLGVLVCAAHPELTDLTRTLWAPIRQRAPVVNPSLAAVHARQRGMPEILNSLSKQLSLPEGATDPQRFVRSVASRAEQPVIVVDALDESPEMRAITAEVLLPLVNCARSDGRPAARLLVAARATPYLEDLRQKASAAGCLMDLDAVQPGRLKRDIERYVWELLRQCPPYRLRHFADAGRSFAAAVATRLVGSEDPARPGAFLTAALYSHHLLMRTFPISDPEEARRFGSGVPSTVAEVLELDLLTRVDRLPWLRPVLAALAHSRGQGMPATVVTRLAGLWARGDGPEPETVHAILEQSKYYLRQGPDIDGTAVYRLFHQGLADQLRSHPFGPATGPPPNERVALLRRLLAGASDWRSAEPYVLRHAIHHAQAAGLDAELIEDPGFLVHADALTLFPALDGGTATTEERRLIRAVYRTSYDLHRAGPPVLRRRFLSVDAARWGAAGLSHRLGNVPVSDHPADGWRVAWATGSLMHPAQRGVLTGPGMHPRLAACTLLDDRTVTVLSDLSVWDLADIRLLTPPDSVPASAIACLGHQAIYGRSDGTVTVWNLLKGERARLPATGDSPVTALVCAMSQRRPIAVSGDADGVLRIWDLYTRELLGQRSSPSRQMVASVACVQRDDRMLIAASYRSGAVRIWDTEARALDDAVAAVALTVMDLESQPQLVTGGRDGGLRVWDPAEPCQLGATLRTYAGIRAIAATEINGHPIVLSADDAVPVLHMWDLRTRRRLGVPLTGHTSPVTSVVCTRVHGLPTAVSCAVDGTVRVWDLTEHRELGRPQIGHTRPLQGCWPSKAGDVPAVSVSDGAVVNQWDLATRRNLTQQPGNTQTSQRSDALGSGAGVTAEGPGPQPRTAKGYPSGIVRFWSSPGGGPEAEVAVPGPVRCLAFDADERLLVGFGVDLVVYEPRVRSSPERPVA